MLHAPTLFICDFVEDVVDVVESHSPDFINPFRGLLGNPTDGRLLEVLKNPEKSREDLISYPFLDGGYVHEKKAARRGTPCH